MNCIYFWQMRLSLFCDHKPKYQYLPVCVVRDEGIVARYLGLLMHPWKPLSLNNVSTFGTVLFRCWFRCLILSAVTIHLSNISRGGRLSAGRVSTMFERMPTIACLWAKINSSCHSAVSNDGKSWNSPPRLIWISFKNVFIELFFMDYFEMQDSVLCACLL